MRSNCVFTVVAAVQNYYYLCTYLLHLEYSNMLETRLQVLKFGVTRRSFWHELSVAIQNPKIGWLHEKDIEWL